MILHDLDASRRPVFPKTSPDAISCILPKQQENTESLRNTHMGQHHELALTGGIPLCFDLDSHQLAV